MFTGIIAALGKVVAVKAKGGDVRLEVATQKLELNDVKLGDSIAVNGVCLTVISMQSDSVYFDVSKEGNWEEKCILRRCFTDKEFTKKHGIE